MIIISIVTYNNGNIIGEAINSIIKFSENIDYKIVIYDNDSTDNTREVIHNLMRLNKNIDIISSNINHGFGYGHNRVIENYVGDYYVIYNPDVFIRSNILEELKTYMDQHIDVGMTTPKVIYPNGDLQYLCKQNPTFMDLFFRRFIPGFLKLLYKSRNNWYEMRQTCYDKEFIIPYATGAFMFFRGNIIKRLNGFDEHIFMYLEDADITRRTNEISKVVFYPYDYIIHLWNRGSHKSLYLTWINIKSVIYYFKKWGIKIY